MITGIVLVLILMLIIWVIFGGKSIPDTQIGILRLISADQEVLISKTDGTETIIEAADVFSGHIDSNPIFQLGDNRGCPEPETLVEIYEMVKDGTFYQVFADLHRPLDEMCLTQAQIKHFVRNQRRWLCVDGCKTFFLFKKENYKKENKIFVASVQISDVGPWVSFRDVGNFEVHRGRRHHRVVVPRQK